MPETIVEKDYRTIVVKLPMAMWKCVEKFVIHDTHYTISEFVREAIRDKILKEAPELYEQITGIR